MLLGDLAVRRATALQALPYLQDRVVAAVPEVHVLQLDVVPAGQRGQRYCVGGVLGLWRSTKSFMTL